jgi:hypothetical protein
MAEYQRLRRLDAPADDVFAFVSNAENLAAILPTVRSIAPAGEGHVRIRGETHGRPFEDAGWFRVDEARRRIEWGADAGDYHGWLTVAGANGDAEVAIHLSLGPRVDTSGRPITGEASEEPDPVEEGLETALDSLRNLMEGTGGNEEPGVTA